MIQLEERDITPKLIIALIKGNDEAHYERLQAYYEGETDIIYRTMPRTTQPNNKLVNSFSSYIVDVSLGYFMGKPVSYTSLEEDMMEKFQDVFDNNDEADENVELAKAMGIKGRVYEMLYVDEESQPRFGVVDPENAIIVYNNSINPEPIFAIRYYLIGNPEDEKEVKELYIEVYTTNKIYYYKGKDEDKPVLTLLREMDHPFSGVPIIEFANNDERQGDFEKVLALIDGYDLSQSNSANTFEYNDDAILKIINMGDTKGEDLDDMRAQRAIKVEAGGDIAWVTKTENDTAIENYKNRLQDDIHRFSMTPDLTDEAFAGNLSGIALEFKLWGLEQKVAQKERKFKRALQRRIELLCNFFKIKGFDYDWRDISPIFTRNIPANITDLVDMVVKLKGIVSDTTLLSQLPFIEDPAEELALIANEFDLDNISEEIIPIDEEPIVDEPVITEEVPIE